MRALLYHAAAPLTFWLDALSTATYLLNRCPCRARNHSTPHDLLPGCSPDYSTLRVFGCRCYPNTAPTAPHKLAPRSVSCIFIGYPVDTKGYRCYNPVTKHVITSRHVYFDEDLFPFRSTTASSCPPAPARHTADTDALPFTAPRRPTTRHQELGTGGAPYLPHDVVEPGIHVDHSSAATASTPATAISPAVGSPASQGVSMPPPTGSPPPGVNSDPSPGTSASSFSVASPAVGTATSSSTATNAVQSQRRHHMVTQLRAGIRQPNPKYAHHTSVSAPPAPSSVHAALRDPAWFAAMQEVQGVAAE